MSGVAKVRASKGMTQLQLSLLSGVPQQTISAIESGDRKNPGILTMLMIARALECSVEELWEVDQPCTTAEE